jgi:hypothetical protein
LGVDLKVFLGFVLIALGSSLISAAPVPQKTVQQLAAALGDHMAATPTIAGEAMTVRTPAWTWSGAIGMVSGNKMLVTPHHHANSAMFI